MTTKHTPTPWRVDPKYPADVQTEDGLFEITETWDQSEADRAGFSLLKHADTDTANANAAFIVRAVNNHEALVEIVRSLSADVMGDDDVNQMVDFGTAVDRARALLAALDANPE